MDRRQLLRSAAFFTVAAAGGTALAHDERDDNDEEDRAPRGRFTFPQGVASGDPKPRSVVFWTRCVRAEGPGRPVRLRLQVALDAGFERIVADARLIAVVAWDHTVRAKITHLPAGHTLYYRFIAGRDASPVGRTRTAPEHGSQPTQLKFAWFTCQDWSVNHWGAMSLLAAQDLDFVVHVGDYVYETVGAAFQAGQAEPAHGPIVFPDGTTLPDGSRYATSLADYRTLYRTYRGDTRLQAVHARFPFIATWDDHEFSDDCWQDHQTYNNANTRQTARRRAANQAWVEYMPVDFGDVSFDPANAAYDNLRIYRDFRFGELMHLVMTDERLYRDDHIVSQPAGRQGPLLGNPPRGLSHVRPSCRAQGSQPEAELARPHKASIAVLGDLAVVALASPSPAPGRTALDY